MSLRFVFKINFWTISLVIVGLLSIGLLLVSCGDSIETQEFEYNVDPHVGEGSTYDDDDANNDNDPCNSLENWECNPITNKGCEQALMVEDGEFSCVPFEYSVAGVETGNFTCVKGCEKNIGESCNFDKVEGAYNSLCRAGSMCVSDTGLNSGEGLCAAFCCESADCKGAEECQKVDQLSFVKGDLGVCLPADVDVDAGVDSGVDSGVE